MITSYIYTLLAIAFCFFVARAYVIRWTVTAMVAALTCPASASLVICVTLQFTLLQCSFWMKYAVWMASAFNRPDTKCSVRPCLTTARCHRMGIPMGNTMGFCGDSNSVFRWYGMVWDWNPIPVAAVQSHLLCTLAVYHWLYVCACVCVCVCACVCVCV